MKSVIGIQEARIIVKLEQYSRRTNIKIFGVPETANNGGKQVKKILLILLKTFLKIDCNKLLRQQIFLQPIESPPGTKLNLDQLYVNLCDQNLKNLYLDQEGN